MSQFNIMQALTVSEIMEWDATDYGPDVQSEADRLRAKHPGLKEAYDEYIEAKHKYDMLFKLVKVTDKF